MSSNRKKGGKERETDEVSELLQAAEDEMLLKLSVNTHMSRASHIDSDLDRRFQALKSKPSKPKPSKPTTSTIPPPVSPTIQTHDVIDNDDLLARFTALRSSLPSSSNKSSVIGGNLDGKVGSDDEDEVEKLMKWAIDAARLDPSPPSDTEEEEDSDDDDDERINCSKRGRSKKGRSK